MVDGVAALRALLAPDQPIAVLAGAGISLDHPSSLLDGRRFVREILAHTIPKGERVESLQSLIDRPQRRLSRPGEYLRFETLMMCLEQSRFDPELRVLECLDRCDRPNPNHYVLATLLHRGCVVMTTNLDRLLYPDTSCSGAKVFVRRRRRPTDFCSRSPSALAARG